jgi:hypothetical protein
VERDLLTTAGEENTRVISKTMPSYRGVMQINAFHFNLLNSSVFFHVLVACI